MIGGLLEKLGKFFWFFPGSEALCQRIGARSRNALSIGSTQRSPGSLTCEAAEISFASVMTHLHRKKATRDMLSQRAEAAFIGSPPPLAYVFLIY